MKLDSNRNNVKMKDLTKEDLIDIERWGFWHRSYQSHFFQNFLDVKHVEEVDFSSHVAPHAEGLAIRFILEEFFKTKKIKVEKIVNIGNDSDYSPRVSNIEYENGKFRSCLLIGQYMLAIGKDKYLLSVDTLSQGFMDFVFVARKEAKIKAKDLTTDLTAYAASHNYLKGKKIDGDLTLIDLKRKYGWDDLILDKYTNKALQTNLMNLIDNVEVYEKNNLPLKRGLIISGEPGTGKSLLGKILCHKTDWTFMWITPKSFHDIESVSNIMKTARMLGPTILFLEDIDLYGKHRDQNALASLLGELMNQLDGIEDNNYVVTIATTNNQDALEKALINRPGRFDKVIRFNSPTNRCREQMFKTFIGHLRTEKTIDMEELVDRTDRFTGAQVKEVVNQAVLQAIDDKSYDEKKILTLKKKHFEIALNQTRNKDFKAAVGFGLGIDVNGVEAALPTSVDNDYPEPTP